MHEVKTYGINRKEVLTGDWEELNKEMYVIYIYTKQLQGLLLHANIN